MKKTSISSIVCLDIIDFAKKSITEQQANKKRLDDLVAQAVVDIPEKDRLIVDTGHGTIISCSGPLENALEDALFIALTVRDEVLNTNTEMEHPLYVLIGINLGSVKVENSINVNEAPKIIGEGLIEAQRIMSFANPNQILVSRAYFDMASKLTLEIAQMFEKYDMHAYEHDIYAVRLLNEKAISIDSTTPIGGNEAVGDEIAPQSSNINWRIYLLPIVLAIAMLFALTKWMNTDSTGDNNNQPTLTDGPAQPVETTPPANEAETALENMLEEDTTQALPKETEVKNSPEKTEQAGTAVKKSPPKKKTTNKATTVQTPKPGNKQTDVSKSQATEAPIEKSDDSNKQAETKGEDKSTWDKFTESIKQGADTECSQAQKALNQCN